MSDLITSVEILLRYLRKSVCCFKLKRRSNAASGNANLGNVLDGEVPRGDFDADVQFSVVCPSELNNLIS